MPPRQAYRELACFCMFHCLFSSSCHWEPRPPVGVTRIVRCCLTRSPLSLILLLLLFTFAFFCCSGLGDIVIPGIFIALLLRFDRSQALLRAEAAGDAIVGAAFDKPIFNTTIISYVLGLVTTVLVMYAFAAAQPALLYVVVCFARAA